MWFENAIGREKIKFMFDNEFRLDDSELDSFIIEPNFSLTLRFYCNHIPCKIPKKWKNLNFNSIFLELEFRDMLAINILGYKLGCNCTPEITSLGNETKVIIKNDEFELNCLSSFLFINEIKPYLNKRKR